MNTNQWRFFNKCGICILLAGSLLAVQRVKGAQDVLMSPPPVSTTPQSVQEEKQNNEMDVFSPKTTGENNLPEPFQFGPITVRPHPYYSFVYGNGIQSSTNRGQDTIIQTFSPGISVDLGRHWTFDYTPTLQFYSNKEFRDTVNHSVSLSGGTSYQDWAFGLSQSYIYSDTPLAETAAQTEQQQIITALSASRSFNSKLSANFGLNQNIALITGTQNSYDWSTLDWLNYEFWPRLNAGIGAGVGYTKIDPDPNAVNSSSGNLDQTYEQLQARVNWRATDKISFQVNGGLEDRQFMAPGYDDSVNPIFGASIQYLPFQHTQISLAASRTVSSSSFYVINQQIETTTVGLNLNQRLLQKYHLNLGLNYAETKYDVSLAGLGIGRTDDNYSFSASLSRSFLKRGTVAVTYQYADNTSTAAGYGYHSSQIGFQVGFAY